MLRLNLHRTPEWIDLGGGVEVHCQPLTSAMFLAASNDGEFLAVPKDAAPEAFLVAFNKAVARRVITGWRGVGDMDGNEIAPSPEAIDALFDLAPIMREFNYRVVYPHQVLVTEKNVSAPSPNGTSAAGGNIAGTAKRPAKTARRAKTPR